MDNQYKALEKRINERNEIETARREQEQTFLKTQNENLEKFLRNFDTSKHWLIFYFWKLKFKKFLNKKT